MKGLVRTNKRAKAASAAVQKIVLKIRAKAFQIDGASGVGWGTVVLGGLPQGNILILGAAAYLQFTTAAAGVQAAFDGDYSIGTTPTDDATLSGTDANVFPSTALGAATSKVSPMVRGISVDPVAPLDNTDGSLELNLNVLIDDANISADNCDFLVSGAVYVLVSTLGDDYPF